MAECYSMHMMVVDDHAATLLMLRNLLRRPLVDAAGNALAKLDAGNFGLTASDWNAALTGSVRHPTAIHSYPSTSKAPATWLAALCTADTAVVDG